MKYYFCTVKECSGGCEYDSHFVMKSEDIEKDFRQVCLGFRGDYEEGTENDPDEFGLVWSDNSAVDTNDSEYREIPKEDFQVLTKYLANL
jgi:hypothetical protein